MRVLLINKYHYLRGGAERSYFDTAELLASHGHEVAFFSMKHPENLPTEWSKYFIDQIDYQNETNLFKKITAVINIFYNFRARKNLEELINEFKPDVAHLHNIYHQLSPSIISVLKKHNIPVIMTLHDYKLICPNYNLYASGQIWEKSKPDKFYQAFLSKAVKNSYLKSFICAVEAYSHKLWGI
ncbi:glycosyltransferase family 1 protein, partial [Candidatus Falkowbacteria bacterium CG10_big_fil_rev_8_21_14_0_10_38_22]